MIEVVRTKALVNRVDGFMLMLMISQLDASHIIIVRWCDGERASEARPKLHVFPVCRRINHRNETKTAESNPIVVPRFYYRPLLGICDGARTLVQHKQYDRPENFICAVEFSRLTGNRVLCAFERYGRCLCRPLAVRKTFTELITQCM